MNTLFDEQDNLPEGFRYYHNFITVEEERFLGEVIHNTELPNMMFQGFEAKRKVASFGVDFNFETRKSTKGRDIPAAFFPLIDKVAKHISIAANEFEEVLLTEYPPGAVINWHRDAPPFDLIAGVSLLTDCIFKLRPHDKALQNRKAIISLPVQSRSLYIIEGTARSDWQHSIAPVTQTRYSITLRTMRK